MNKTLGEVVIAARQRIGLTQRELARKIDVSNSTISRIENNDGIIPDAKTLRAISDALHLDYNYVLALSGQIDDDPEIREIQRVAERMTPEDKDKMMNLLHLVFTDYFESSGTDTEKPVSPKEMNKV